MEAGVQKAGKGVEGPLLESTQEVVKAYVRSRWWRNEAELSLGETNRADGWWDVEGGAEAQANASRPVSAAPSAKTGG